MSDAVPDKLRNAQISLGQFLRAHGIGNSIITVLGAALRATIPVSSKVPQPREFDGVPVEWRTV